MSVVMEETYKYPAMGRSFEDVNALYRAVRDKVTIQKWLRGVDSYTLHKSVRRNFPTNRVIAYSIHQQY